MTASLDHTSPAEQSQDAVPLPAVLSATRTEFGRIHVQDRVVSKIVAQAAAEVTDAGAPTPQLLGRAISKVGLGTDAGTELDRAPKVSADVDGSLVFLELKLSVRWPASIPRVTEAVRRHVIDRVTNLVGLSVQEINVTVVDLVTTITTSRVA